MVTGHVVLLDQRWKEISFDIERHEGLTELESWLKSEPKGCDLEGQVTPETESESLPNFKGSTRIGAKRAFRETELLTQEDDEEPAVTKKRN